MEVETFERLITSVGFPIVMCGLLIYYIIKLMEKNTEEVKELREAINDNTNALESIKTILNIFTNNGNK